MAKTETRRVLIKVDSQGVKQALDAISSSMGTMNKNIKRMSGDMGLLSNAFRGWLGYLGVREIVQMADSMQNLSNKLKITSGGVEGASLALKGLTDIADRTNQSVAGVGDVYNRLALSLQGAKASTNEVLTLTENLINTFRVSGATTTETVNTIIQLSQAFSSGELRGQELRSVMEQNAVMAELLKKKFGQDIYKKAADGAIKVVDVLKVLRDNQDKLITQAKELAPTFEQSVTKAMNKLSLAVGALNEKWGLSAKFASVIGVVSDNLGGILITLGGVVVGLAVAQIPALIGAIGSLKAALFSLSTSNIILLTLTAISVALGVLYENWDKVTKAANLFKAEMLDLGASIEGGFGSFMVWITEASGGKTAEYIKKNSKDVEALKNQAQALRDAYGPMQGPRNATPEERAKADMDSLIKKLEGMTKAKNSLPKLKDELGDLNKQLDDGIITWSQYQQRLSEFELYKANREFREGKRDAYAYHEQLIKLEEMSLNRMLRESTISLSDFNQTISANKIQLLNEQFEGGRISLTEYNKQLNSMEEKFTGGSAFQAGVQSYIDSVGTLSTNIAKGIEQAFGHLEKSFLEFMKTGKFKFKEFAQSILDDLNAIIVRSMIIRPLAQGILNFAMPGASGAGGGDTIGGGFGGDRLTANAKGNAFEGGKIIPFARGGIVDSPTAFSFGGGRNKGIMGEAGTEAILPLGRGANGDLGVQASVTPVTVNIINQAGSSVEQVERTGPNGEKTIDILITNKVREGISTGKFDSAFRQSYGLNRKGS